MPIGWPPTSTRSRRRAADGSADPSLRLQPLSVAGLLAVCLVIAGGHAVVAYYGTQFQSALSCIFDPDGTNQCDAPTDTPDPSDGGPASSRVTARPPRPPARRRLGTPLPTAALPQWNGKDRLNILLIGADQRPKEGTFNTDTLIVVSIDPTTKQVAMFSLPRDTVDVPIPAGPARSVFGSVYRGKINSLWLNARYRADAFPGTDKSRGFNALKSVLGELYGLDIQYYVMVNFEGFKNIVDTLGGVTINVQNPVLDDHYPGGPAGASIRVYIPAGVQHMNGAQALIYARSRHTSSDFDRAQRQQRVILSIREQADPGQGPGQPDPAPDRPQDVVQDRHPAGQAARPDRPVEPDRLDQHPLVRVRAAALRQQRHRCSAARSSCPTSARSARPWPTRSRRSTR